MSDVEAELATSASLTSVIATQKSRTAAMNPMIAAAANFLSRTILDLLSTAYGGRVQSVGDGLIGLFLCGEYTPG